MISLLVFREGVKLNRFELIIYMYRSPSAPPQKSSDLPPADAVVDSKCVDCDQLSRMNHRVQTRCNDLRLKVNVLEETKFENERNIAKLEKRNEHLLSAESELIKTKDELSKVARDLSDTKECLQSTEMKLTEEKVHTAELENELRKMQRIKYEHEHTIELLNREKERSVEYLGSLLDKTHQKFVTFTQTYRNTTVCKSKRTMIMSSDNNIKVSELPKRTSVHVDEPIWISCYLKDGDETKTVWSKGIIISIITAKDTVSIKSFDAKFGKLDSIITFNEKYLRSCDESNIRYCLCYPTNTPVPSSDYVWK